MLRGPAPARSSAPRWRPGRASWLGGELPERCRLTLCLAVGLRWTLFRQGYDARFFCCFSVGSYWIAGLRSAKNSARPVSREKIRLHASLCPAIKQQRLLSYPAPSSSDPKERLPRAWTLIRQTLEYESPYPHCSVALSFDRSRACVVPYVRIQHLHILRQYNTFTSCVQIQHLAPDACLRCLMEHSCLRRASGREFAIAAPRYEVLDLAYSDARARAHAPAGARWHSRWHLRRLAPRPSEVREQERKEDGA